MNKQMSIIGGAILVIALVGAGAFFVMSKSQKSESLDMTPVDGIESTEKESSSKASIKSLIGANKNVSCTITYPDDGGSGTVYVGGQKIRGDFTTKSGETNVESSMISDGEYMYMWSSTQGTKMKIDVEVKASPTTSGQTTDLDSEVDMDCDSWSVDESMFEIPTNVKFTDMSAMMGQMQQQTQTNQNAQPDVCASITDPQAKAACVSALGQ